jgi:hypothetical protein
LTVLTLELRLRFACTGAVKDQSVSEKIFGIAIANANGI